MEDVKKDEFASKFMFVLKKIAGSQSINIDNIYLEKLLSSIRTEFGDNHDHVFKLPELYEWLSEVVQTWRHNHPSVTVAGFICQLIGILSANEEIFNIILKTNMLNELLDILQPYLVKNTSLKLAQIKLLSDVLNHDSGCNWLKTSKQWKKVIQLCFLNYNMYIEREGIKFLTKLVSKAGSDDNLIDEIFREIILPLNEKKETLIKDKHLDFKSLLSLKMLGAVLKVFIYSENDLAALRLFQIFDIENFLKLILEHCDEETNLDEASTLYVIYLMVKNKNKRELLLSSCIDAQILEIFYHFLKQDQIENIIKLAKFCQALWSEMRQALSCNTTVGVHFIIFQLIPQLIYTKKPPDTRLFDLFVQKLFNVTSESTQKFCYSYKDAIKNRNDSKAKDRAIKGVLSLTANIENLNQDEAVIIFQALVYSLKIFVPESCYDDEFKEESTEHFGKEMMLCVSDASYLSAVLNALSTLIEKFKINWTESLETLFLLKMTCSLLQNTQLSCVLVVHTLLLVKLAILNFMSPNLALLINKPEDSSLEYIMPLLYKRMHDPHWEIRDSCIEVITAIAELAESKYPAFQELLIEKDFCSLILDILEGDSESYVRASALRALSAMTKIEGLKQCFNKSEFPLKIIELLQTETEAIVRREAVILINQIYVHLNETLDNSIYQVMSYTSISDLHWEVKVNSLVFWETVIQRIITDQGMIDGSFPKVTFSKEHKKIVTLTQEEIKHRLDKVLTELSKIGCLHVLLSTLDDDCDFQVVQKSVQILSNLINILRRYGVLKPCESVTVCNRTCVKRKNTDLINCDKRKPPNDISSSNDFQNQKTSENDCPSADSDAVIEEIVNEMDINLLVSVCYSNEGNNTLENKIPLQEMKPETFLMRIQSFNGDKFLEKKQKWLMSVEFDLNSLVNDIILVNSVNETNIMDCY